MTVHRRVPLGISGRALAAAAADAGVTVDALLAQDRRILLAHRRFAAMIVMLEAGMRKSEIARRCRRDDTTVSKYLRQGHARWNTEPAFLAIVDRVRAAAHTTPVSGGHG